MSVLSVGLKRPGVFPLLLEFEEPSCHVKPQREPHGQVNPSEATPAQPSSNQPAADKSHKNKPRKPTRLIKAQAADPQKEKQNKWLLFQVTKLWGGLLLHETN